MAERCEKRTEERPPEKSKQGESGMRATPVRFTYSEVKGDLFTCPATASLVHCVSEDFNMGKGIATKFKKQFGGVADLRAQGV